MTEDCVFCEMFLRDGEEGPELLDIEPLNPVVEGHRIVIPREHVRDFAENGEITAKVMKYISGAYHDGHFNIITSKGRHATQSVFHLHVHVVPRWEDDGITLPWTGQITTPPKQN